MIMSVKRQLVKEVPYGLYVWRMPDGRWVGDDQGNFLNVQAMEGDLTKIQMLVNAVKEFGIEEGSPLYLSGNRRVTDEEYEEQIMRMKWGLIPDPEDVGALADEARWRKQYGR